MTSDTNSQTYTQTRRISFTWHRPFLRNDSKLYVSTRLICLYWLILKVIIWRRLRWMEFVLHVARTTYQHV